VAEGLVETGGTPGGGGRFEGGQEKVDGVNQKQTTPQGESRSSVCAGHVASENPPKGLRGVAHESNNEEREAPQHLCSIFLGDKRHHCRRQEKKRNLLKTKSVEKGPEEPPYRTGMTNADSAKRHGDPKKIPPGRGQWTIKKERFKDMVRGMGREILEQQQRPFKEGGKKEPRQKLQGGSCREE